MSNRRADKKTKYGNVRTEIDGITFDSAREARRWCDLRLLERAGVISGLRRQVKWPLHCGGVKVCDYISDFDYEENGSEVTEDAKGVRTAVFNLKAKMFKAQYGREIKIT